jgi:hypothetical protein
MNTPTDRGGAENIIVQGPEPTFGLIPERYALARM